MKILHIGKYFPPYNGGIETVTETIVEEISKRGYDCDVVCSGEKKRGTEENKKGYKVFRLATYGQLSSQPISPALIPWLIRRRKQYQIVHVHLPNPLAELAIFIARPTGKLILHWHANIDEKRFRYLKSILRPLRMWTANTAAKIVGATKSHIQNSDIAQLAAAKTAIIPYPFRADRQAQVDGATAKSPESRESGGFTILSVGRLVSYKGFDILIDAAKLLPDDCRILIAGDGELKARLSKRIESNKVSHKVRLLGAITANELARLYDLCSVFCFPSTESGEMFGMVQLEAMLAGKPIIGFEIPKSGVHEVNINGETGILINDQSAESLSKAILDLKDDEDSRKKMGDNGRRRVLNIYESSKVIPQFISLYRE